MIPCARHAGRPSEAGSRRHEGIGLFALAGICSADLGQVKGCGSANRMVLPYRAKSRVRFSGMPVLATGMLTADDLIEHEKNPLYGLLDGRLWASLVSWRHCHEGK